MTLLSEWEGGVSHHGLQESVHDGYVTFSEVEGMYAKDEKALLELGLNINTSGPWKVKCNTRKVSRLQPDGTYKVRAPALVCHIVSAGMREYARVIPSNHVYAHCRMQRCSIRTAFGLATRLASHRTLAVAL